MTDVPEWISRGREAADLSAEELSEQVDADTEAVEAWEAGEETPTVAEMQELRDVIGAPDSVPDGDEDSDDNGRDIDFEEKLFTAADKLRNNLDAAVYKHVVLGLIFLKYISDAFEERRDQLEDEQYADPEDRDEYRADNIFWVPEDARWSHLQAPVFV